MSYYGSWKIDDLLTFYTNTHRFDTGAATDADAPPTYRVYEDETATPILTGTMALLDSSNTAGFYSEQITLSAANGFEKGKCYTIYITATVNSVAAATHHNFQLEAEVDANTVSPIAVNANVTQYGGNAGTFSGGRPEVNVSHWKGTAAATVDTAGYPVVTIKDGTGAGEIALTSGAIDAVTLVATATTLTNDPTGVTTLLSRLGTPSNLGGGATIAANLADIEAQTDDIGTAGAGLSAIPWNASWDAEVQSEANDALVANNLDHLVLSAVDTDFATTVHLDSVIGHLADGGGMATYDRTTDSLEINRDQVALAIAYVDQINGTTATIEDAVITEVADIKAKTDQMVFTTANRLDVQVFGMEADAITAASLAADAGAEIGTAVWASATRVLTAGTNIVLAKGVGVTGFNDLSAAQVNTEVDTAIADARLDELLVADSDIDGAAPPAVGSVFHELMSKTAGSFTFDQTTDALEAIRDRGDAAWVTATGFSTHTAADVWAVATRVLTAGTNIVLAKGTGVTGFNDLSAAQVNSEVDIALADINLDHLLFAAVDTDFATTVHLNSVMGHLADNGSSATFDRATDSLEAIRAEGDASWGGGGGGGGMTPTYSATALAGTMTTISFPVAASAVDNFYRGQIIELTGGTGAGQCNRITIYDGSLRRCLLSSPWVVAPDSTTTFNLWPQGRADMGTWLGFDVNALQSGRVDSYIGRGGVMVSQMGTAQAGTATTITLENTASAVNDIYVDQVINIHTGTGAGQSARIIAYVGSSRLATINKTWPVTPDVTSQYRIWYGGAANVGSWKDAAVNAPISGRIESHMGAATAGVITTTVAPDLATLAAILADTDNIQARLPTTLIGGRMDASVGAMATDTLTAAALAADAATEIRNAVSGYNGALGDGSGHVKVGYWLATAIPANVPANLNFFFNVSPTTDNTVNDVGVESAAEQTAEAVWEFADRALTDKAGFNLASTGLDQISAADPDGVATTFREKIVAVWNRFYGRVTKTATQLKTYDADDNALTTQTVESSGLNEEIGRAE
jgi:hypothetical protein